MPEEQRTRRRFRTGIRSGAAPEDPESLFRDLKRRSANIPYLWSHQADILRDYFDKHLSSSDLALELPTGAGKTLIGLLIAEFRRRSNGERVVYLCPTRQLANQVYAHSVEYGIEAKLILAPDYDGINDYRMADSVAITTYSSVFNTNPRFNDPQALVMDDAHAAEGYIANPWTVIIQRKDSEQLYRDLIHVLEGDLDRWTVSRLLEDVGRADWQHIDMVPGPLFHRHVASIRNLLDEEQENEQFADRHSWRFIKDNLDACCMLTSWSEIVIRPVIPPTETHQPFSSASQRIYMSATLGEGGELERLTGVANIARLPVPAGWDKQGSGRRLFLFPDLASDRSEWEFPEIEAMQFVDRSLVLTPTIRETDEIRAKVQNAGMVALSSESVQASMATFTEATNVALVLANRYDGIDLPGESCRLLVMKGLPAGIGALEKFLYHRLLVRSVFKDRIRTRFTQGVGRCTRAASDFAVVIATGQELLDFCARADERSTLHPELQAEIEFGLANSKELPWADFLGLMQTFLDRDEGWQEAEEEILTLRSETSRQVDELFTPLADVVSHEIAYCSAMWRKDYRYALERATSVVDRLNSPELKGYKSWWAYLGAMAAWMHAEVHPNAPERARARVLFRLAAQNSNVEWFTRLAEGHFEDEEGLELTNEDRWALQNAHDRLSKLGFSGSKFERRISSDLKEQISSDDSSAFERGIRELGYLLGFNAFRETTPGAPDGVWMYKDRCGLIFEAKSEETPEDAISYDTVRQANGHEQWVRQNMDVAASDAEFVTVVVTPRRTISEAAKQQSSDLFYMKVEDLRALAEDVAGALRRVRSTSAAPGNGDSGELNSIANEFKAAKLTLSNVVARARQVPLHTLPEG